MYLLLPSLSMAQWVAAGVTGGVPISPQSQQSAPGFLLDGTSGPNDLILRPYLVGATVQVRLLRELSAVVEFDYERMHEDFTYFNVRGPIDFGTRGSASANVWLFPMLIRYDIAHRGLSPFVDAGVTLRNLGTFNGSGYHLDFYLQPQPEAFHTVPGGNPDIAITADAGVRIRVLSFDLTPEVRFMHWTSSYFIPAQNQAMLIIGATFPARHR